jgi:HPt (histidine-containing phosphotransfer) domain-containing protein
MTMNKNTSIRYLSMFSLIAFVVGMTFAVVAFRRVSTLRSFDLANQVALKSLYRLGVETDVLYHSTTNLERAYTSWLESIETAGDAMERVTEHPGLGLLSSQSNVRVEQANRLWDESRASMLLGDELISRALNDELPGIPRSNLAAMADASLELIRSDSTSPGDRASYQLLLRGVGQVGHASGRLRTFVGNDLEELGRELEASVAEVARTTILVGGAIGTILLLSVAIALASSVRFLGHANLTLEESVRARTRAIQGLLDFSGQGFLSFGPDLVVRPEISRECAEIFGASVVGKNIASLLFPDDREASDFVTAMRMVFSGRSRPEVVLELFERRIQLGDKTIEVDFRQIDGDQVMCSLSDVTPRIALEERLAIQTSRQEMLLRIVASRDHFFALVEEWENLSAAMGRRILSGEYVAGPGENGALIRDVHTFKANAAFLRMEACVSAAHSLETALIDHGVLGESSRVVGAVSALSDAYREETDHVIAAVGQEWSQRRNTISVERCVIDELLDHARRTVPDNKALLSGLTSIRKVSAGALVSRWSDLAGQLAAGRGKQVRVETEHGDCRFSPETHEALSQAVTHLIRNMVDHGIEYPRERERAGKDSVGRIRIVITQSGDGHTEVAVSDDGAGINLEKLAERARRMGIIHEGDAVSRKELVKLVFRPGFSTAETTTEVSGRGVGAGAALELVQRIGGRMSMTTREGHGTTFLLSIPDPDREINYCES